MGEGLSRITLKYAFQIIRSKSFKVGLNPGTYFGGDYVLEVAFSGVDIREAGDSQLNKVQAGFSVAEDPGVFIYVDDVFTGEGSPRVSGNAPVVVTEPSFIR